MTRRWLVVIEDPDSEFTLPEELENYLKALVDSEPCRWYFARVQRGGLLAQKVMEELPPVRHKDQGAYR